MFVLTGTAHRKPYVLYIDSRCNRLPAKNVLVLILSRVPGLYADYVIHSAVFMRGSVDRRAVVDEWIAIAGLG